MFIVPINSALRLIRYLIDRIFEGQEAAVSIRITLSPTMPVGQTITVRQTQAGRLMITLQDDFQLPLTVSGVDSKGKPSPLENVRYAASDTNLVAVDAAGLVTVGPLAGVDLPVAAQVTVTADSLIGDGSKYIVGILDLSIVAGEAVTINVTGTPVPAAGVTAAGTPPATPPADTPPAP